MSEKSRVLKAHSPGMTSSAIAFNFEDLRRQGEAYLVQARAEADQLVAAARQEVAKLRSDAQTQGRDAGYKEGLRAAQEVMQQSVEKLAHTRFEEQIRDTLPALRAVATEVIRLREQWLQHWETAAIDLSLAIAETLLRQRLEVDPEAALGAIRETLRLAAGNERMTIHLNPRDLERMGDHAASIVESLTLCARVELKGDAGITPGGCLIETPAGTIDGRMETMLARVASELLQDEAH